MTDPQTSLSKFRSLLHISSILNANLDLHQLLPLIMLYSKDLLEAEASSLFLLENDEFLYCEVALGEKGEIIQEYARLEFGEGIVGMVAKEKSQLPWKTPTKTQGSIPVWTNGLDSKQNP